MADRQDFELGRHLPKRRPEGAPLDPRRQLPRQRRGVTPQMLGRFPDYDVLDEGVARTWDAPTRAVVEARLDLGGRAFQFFQPAELPTLRAFCDVCTAQDQEPRVPVAEMLDAKYHEGRLDGYQYAGMPDDRETWHRVLSGLDFSARSRHRKRFAALDSGSRAALVGDLHQGILSGGPWEGLDVKRAFAICMRGILAAFYSHPWAWNEIGFGGPAYPRGFMAFGPLNPREPFEQADQIGRDPVPDVSGRELA